MKKIALLILSLALFCGCMLVGCGSSADDSAKTVDQTLEEIYAQMVDKVEMPAMVRMDEDYITNYYGMDLSVFEEYVFAAAEAEDGVAIGTDSDQYYLSDSVIFSYLKNVGNSAKLGLDMWENGNFESGIHTVGLAEDGVGLALDHAKLDNVTKEMYEDWCKTYLEGGFGKILSAEDITDDEGNSTGDLNALYEALDSQNIDFQVFE